MNRKAWRKTGPYEFKCPLSNKRVARVYSETTGRRWIAVIEQGETVTKLGKHSSCVYAVSEVERYLEKEKTDTEPAP